MARRPVDLPIPHHITCIWRALVHQALMGLRLSTLDRRYCRKPPADGPDTAAAPSMYWVP